VGQEPHVGGKGPRRRFGRIVLFGIAVLAAVILVKMVPRQRPPEPANVLLLFIDTLRADRMSLYGHPRKNTPHIEAFAATATVFERAYSPTSSTRNSFASYFTGLHPAAHGCEGQHGVLASGHFTLAERFRGIGYTTVGIFTNYNIAGALGFDQGFDIYHHPPANAGYPGDFQVTDAAALNQRVLRWLREERPADPWFLFVLYIDPHDPYLPHAGAEHGPPPFTGVSGSRHYLDRLYHKLPEDRREEVQDYIRGLYDGEIAFVDAHVGELLAVLEEEGLAEDTVVVISSDHGEGLWDHHGYRGHGRQVYEEQIHVPLVVRWPGRSRAGLRVRTPVAVLDVFGALATAFDLATPQEYQAGSLLDALAGEPEPRAIYAAQRRGGIGFRVLVEWPWKLLQDDHDWRAYLYNLEDDPLERRDLAPQEGSRVTRMLATMEGITEESLERHAQLGAADEPRPLSEEEERELRALGYIR